MAPTRSKSGIKPKGVGKQLNAGLGQVDAILKKQSEKRAAGRTGFVKVSDDEEEPTVARVFDLSLFCEGYVHQVEYEVEDKRSGKKGKTRTWRQDQMCLDQEEEGEPCPGCADELDRRYKFWIPVIWRDAPIVVDDKVTGYKDTIAILSGATRLVNALNRVQKKKGLENQDVEIVKSGKEFNTQYAVDALDREELSEDDEKLIKALDMKKLKEKLGRYTEMRDFDDFYRSPDDDRDDKSDDDDDDDAIGRRARTRGSVFPSRSNKTKDDDDDDGDDDRPRQRRSSRSQARTQKPGASSKPGGLANLGGGKKKTSSKPKFNIKTR